MENVDVERGLGSDKLVVREHEYELWRLRYTERLARSSEPDTNALKGREIIVALELVALVPVGLCEVPLEDLEDLCEAHEEHPMRYRRLCPRESKTSRSIAPDIAAVSKDFKSGY